ncbi:hypothetical protein BQ8794_130077 [Mesorhizobium prunaredense]|uniref:Uncharacterized protein n=1 Tax=Mesorhizobium prunaredense TaxID=1631249 RepID=A0A1R3V128_9HYPH|nr:hypothetical protein BQ8794_130077 [Mesorhizobium prunaredense]
MSRPPDFPRMGAQLRHFELTTESVRAFVSAMRHSSFGPEAITVHAMAAPFALLVEHE